MLDPWIDAGNVGTLTLTWLENQTDAKPLAELARPGMFVDFTRYRPMIYYERNERRVRIPNTHITYTKRPQDRDFLFLRLLEPHMLGETYVESVVQLLERSNIKRYCLLGSMYNFVPHTRPLLVSGGASPDKLKNELKKFGISSSRYEGPTTICLLISQQMSEWGIESMTLIVSLPQYTQLDDDYMGAARLQEILSSLYGIPAYDDIIARARRQREQIDEAISDNSQVQEILEQLEKSYDARMTSKEEPEEPPALSPQVEDFLREMERRFRPE